MLPFSHAAGTSTAVGTSSSNSSKVWSGSIPLQIGFWNITIGMTATAFLLHALLTLAMLYVKLGTVARCYLGIQLLTFSNTCNASRSDIRL